VAKMHVIDWLSLELRASRTIGDDTIVAQAAIAVV